LAARGKNPAAADDGARKPNSVVYVSFGSLLQPGARQAVELGLGLEASGHPFIWVLNNTREYDDTTRAFLRELEARVAAGRRGLVVSGWAPQLAVEVLRIGVSVGVKEPTAFRMDGKEVVVGRDAVEMAVRSIMDGGEEGEERRRRAAALAAKARAATVEGRKVFVALKSMCYETCSRPSLPLRSVPDGTTNWNTLWYIWYLYSIRCSFWATYDPIFPANGSHTDQNVFALFALLSIPPAMADPSAGEAMPAMAAPSAREETRPSCSRILLFLRNLCPSPYLHIQ
ncbi:hypothetical protein EJB05_57463, partial [Eragrostis curvula]